MRVTTVGIDLTKNVLQVHGVTKHCNKVFNNQLRTKYLLLRIPVIVNTSP